MLCRGTSVLDRYGADRSGLGFAGGWFRTGDLAAVADAALGYIAVVDRRKDVIVVGGENVYCSEVEEALAKHPAVLEAAVFGMPEEVLGESVNAAAVLARPCGAVELQKHCAATLAGYKVPTSIAFYDALPKTGSGKVKKGPLRLSLIHI